MELQRSVLGKIKSASGGADEAADGLASVMEESLAERERIGGKNDAVNEGVPAVGFAFVHRFAIALDKPEIFHGAKTI